jgi:hypothetical protein
MKILGEVLWALLKFQAMCMFIAVPATAIAMGFLIWTIVLVERGTLPLDFAMILPAIGSLLTFVYVMWAVHKIDDDYLR